jgi:hypothetical protein
MPEKYNGKIVYLEKDETGNTNKKIKFSSKNLDKSLLEWAKDNNVDENSEGSHLLRHCNLQFFWNGKIIYKTELDKIYLDSMHLEIKANPSDIMYTFQSKNILFKWSEDVQFTIDKNMTNDIIRATNNTTGGAIRGGIEGGAEGAIAGAVTEGTREITTTITGTDTRGANIDSVIHKQIKTVDSKSQKNIQTELKTNIASNEELISSMLGIISTILDSGYVKNNYTLIEFALQFGINNFQIRVEFNENQFERYKRTKQCEEQWN